MVKDTEKKNCDHKNWRCAGYREKDGVYRVTSIYHVYCNDCRKFINLLDGKIIEDKELIWID